jgi:hypothetical protein
MRQVRDSSKPLHSLGFANHTRPLSHRMIDVAKSSKSSNRRETLREMDVVLSAQVHIDSVSRCYLGGRKLSGDVVEGEEVPRGSAPSK